MNENPDLAARLAAAEAEIARLSAREKDPVKSPSRAAEEIRAACENEQETFVVLLLNARQQILHAERVSLGSLARVDVHPRDVFRLAVRMNAHAIVIGHNHPSGAAEPSEADRDLTTRLCDCGRIMGIPVLDHVVVTDTDSFSFAANGLM